MSDVLGNHNKNNTRLSYDKTIMVLSITSVHYVYYILFVYNPSDSRSTTHTARSELLIIVFMNCICTVL